MKRRCTLACALALLAAPLLATTARAWAHDIVANDGRYPEEVVASVHVTGAMFYATTSGLVLDFRTDPETRHAVFFTFENAAPVEPTLTDATNTIVNDLRSGPAASPLRTHRTLRYEDVWAGVDFVLRSTETGLEYEYEYDGTVPPGAGIRVSGAPTVTRDGERTLDTVDGGFRVPEPRSGAGSFTFRLSDEPQRVDGINWASFLGGDGDDNALETDVDAFGNVYVTGTTESSDFPTTPGAYQDSALLSRDGYVTKFAPDGSTLIWSTYLGGNGYDEARAIAVSGGTGPVVVGYTYSADFPVTAGAFDPSHNGDRDFFVCRLDASGGSMDWGTFVGGSGLDGCYRALIGPDNSVIVAGFSMSASYPTTLGAYDRSINGDRDVVLTSLSGDGQTLLWSTFLGGGSGDIPIGIAPTPSGNIVLTGITDSEDFPITLATRAIPRTAFVSVISGDGTELVASRVLGSGIDDWGTSVATDDAGRVYVGGYTLSAGFPVTAGAFDTSHNGDFDGFVSVLSPGLDTIIYSTFVGGGGNDYIHALTLDAEGNPIVAGGTWSSDFPTTADAVDDTYAAGQDAFLARLPATVAFLAYGSFFGGSQIDVGRSLFSIPGGGVLLTGHSLSPEFPVTDGAFQTELVGGDIQGDAYVISLPTPAVVVTPEDPGTLDGIVGTSLSARPNPSPAGVVIQLDLDRIARGSIASVEIFDVAGRTVSRLDPGDVDGSGMIRWDGRAAGGRKLGSGVYAVRVETNDGTHTARVTIVR